MSEIQAAGDMMSGALLGRAVESRAGETPHDAHPAMCLNCGTALVGPHCHQCGQAGHVHRTLASIGHDLLHGVFHFEGKIWNTLPLLVTHPGALTRRYIDGERARFVSPLALFLFAVFLMFAAIHSMGDNALNINVEAPPEARVATLAKLDGEIAKTKAELAKAQVAASKGEVESQGDIAGAQQTLKALQIARAGVASGTTTEMRTKAISRVHSGWSRLDRGIVKANADPALAIYKLQMSAYKYSWALIPISVPFVALLFLWRRKFKLYDHTIFVTYSLAFMMLLATVVTILMIVDAPGWIYGCLIAFAPPVHMFFQLRGAYGLSWFSALWRTVMLLVFASITLTLFLLLLLGMGLMD